MQKISFDQIELASDEINDLSDEKIEALIEQFSNEQPYIMTYLMAVYGDDLTGDERELLFFLGIKIWFVISKSVKSFPVITEEDIENIEADNDEMLNYLSEESEEGFEEFTESLLEEHPQNELLTFVLSGLMEDEEEEDEFDISEDSIGAMFIALKTVIDCFQKKI